MNQMDAFEDLVTRLGAAMKVVGHHRSKSIELPVVKLAMEGVGDFTLRDNFHDINLMVNLVDPCVLTLREFFFGVQAPRDWAWYLQEVEKARGYSWKEWTDDEIEDPRILRVKDKRPGVDMWWEKKGSEKDRWSKRMTDPSWYSNDWSSGILTCDGPFGPGAEIFVQHHAFAEGMDTTGADRVYARGAKRFILAFGSIDHVATLIERLRDSAILASAKSKPDLNTTLTPEEFAARLAEPRPNLEAAMRQGIAEADAAREAVDRARGEAWKRLEGRRFK